MAHLKKAFFILLAIGLLATATIPAMATPSCVIDFETDENGLPWAAPEGYLPSPYPILFGVLWDPGWVRTSDDYSGYFPSSGTNFAFQNGTSTGWIKFPAPVNFEKIWIAGPIEVHLEGFDGAASPYLPVSASGNSWLYLNWNGIDRITFSASSPYYGIDDVTYSNCAPAVPLPGGIMLLGSGLSMLFLRIRRQISKA